MKAVWKDDPDEEVIVYDDPDHPGLLITENGEMVDSADVHIVEDKS